ADHLDNSVRSGAELAKETGLTTVAAIPPLRSSRSLIPKRLRQVMASDLPNAARFSDLLAAIADTAGSDEMHYRQAVLRLLTKIKAHQRPGRPHTVMLAS